MVLSRNWLRDFVDTSDINVKDFCDRMTDTGSKVEGYEIAGNEIDNIRVGLIKKIEQHPDAERLVVCQVDCGEKTIRYSTYASVTGKMTTFSSLLDTYHSPSAADDEKISALFECQQLYANMTDTDMAQIKANDEYSYLITSFESDWEALRRGAEEDMEQAENVNSKALALYLGVAAVSLALGVVALKFFL